MNTLPGDPSMEPGLGPGVPLVPYKLDMARESKLHIYTQQSKINGFSQFLAFKE